MQRIYVETSVISYLTNRPSLNAITLGRQLLTQQWWQHRRGKYDLVVSDFVIQEVGQGHPDAAARRLAVARELTVIESQHPEIARIAQLLLQIKALPAQAELDALHIAACAFNRIEFLVSWNFSHIVNIQQLDLIDNACRDAGYRASRILTLDALP